MFRWSSIHQVISETIYDEHVRNGKTEKTDKNCLGQDCAALDGSPTFYRCEDDDQAEEGKRNPIDQEAPNIGF